MFMGVTAITDGVATIRTLMIIELKLWTGQMKREKESDATGGYGGEIFSSWALYLKNSFIAKKIIDFFTSFNYCTAHVDYPPPWWQLLFLWTETGHLFLVYEQQVGTNYQFIV